MATGNWRFLSLQPALLFPPPPMALTALGIVKESQGSYRVEIVSLTTAVLDVHFSGLLV